VIEKGAPFNGNLLRLDRDDRESPPGQLKFPGHYLLSPKVPQSKEDFDRALQDILCLIIIRKIDGAASDSDDMDDADPEELFMNWLFDQWATSLTDPNEQDSIYNVSSLLQTHNSLYALTPDDRESVFVLDAIEFSRTSAFWDSLSLEDQNWVASMRSRLHHFLQTIEAIDCPPPSTEICVQTPLCWEEHKQRSKQTESGPSFLFHFKVTKGNREMSADDVREELASTNAGLDTVGSLLMEMIERTPSFSNLYLKAIECHSLDLFVESNPIESIDTVTFQLKGQSFAISDYTFKLEKLKELKCDSIISRKSTVGQIESDISDWMALRPKSPRKPTLPERVRSEIQNVMASYTNPVGVEINVFDDDDVVKVVAASLADEEDSFVEDEIHSRPISKSKVLLLK